MVSSNVVARDGGGGGQGPLVELDERAATESSVDLHLQGDRTGIAARSFTKVVNEFTTALEEIDRIAEPEARRRPTWFVIDTSWVVDRGAIVRLGPRVIARGSIAISDPRVPSAALWTGVRALASVPEIPTSFSDRVVERIRTVRAEVDRRNAGLRGVALRLNTFSGESAALTDEVRMNAERAVEPASFAYGSVTGTLDVISARRHKRRVGLLIDHGPAITCEVGDLDEATYFDNFERHVLVEGVLRRNGRGQPVRMEAVRIEVLPVLPKVRAVDLLGALPPLPAGMTATEFVERDRGK